METKNNVSTNTVVGILKKNEPITLWEFKTLFEYIVQAIASRGEEYLTLGLMTNPISQAIESDLKYAVEKTKEISKSITVLETNILDQLDKSYENIKSKYDDYLKKINSLKEHLGEFKLDLPKMEIPYGYEQLLKMLTAYDELPETRKSAFLQIAKELNKN